MDVATFDRLSLVTFAPASIREDLRKVRDRCPPSGRPMLDAHVTIKRPFVSDVPVESFASSIMRSLIGLPPVTIRTIEAEVIADGDLSTVIMPLEESKALDVLYLRLRTALNQFPDINAEDHFRPHLTVVAGVPANGVEQALHAIAGWRINYFWTIRDIDLIGRDAGMTWRQIQQFSFGRRG